MVRHVKAPLRSLCSQLAALHGAPWTPMLLSDALFIIIKSK